jgi:hypothetical protein
MRQAISFLLNRVFLNVNETRRIGVGWWRAGIVAGVARLIFVVLW